MTGGGILLAVKASRPPSRGSLPRAVLRRATWAVVKEARERRRTDLTRKRLQAIGWPMSDVPSLHGPHPAKRQSGSDVPSLHGPHPAKRQSGSDVPSLHGPHPAKRQSGSDVPSLHGPHPAKRRDAASTPHPAKRQDAASTLPDAEWKR